MRKRARTVLVRSLESIAGAAVFAAALAGGLVMHADHAATRRATVAITNQALGTLFRGKIVVGTLEHLSIGRHARVHVAHAEIVDPDGVAVVSADGIDAGIDLERLVRSLLAGRPPEIAIDDPHVANVDVLLDVDAENNLGIARSFDSPPSSGPATPHPPGKPLEPDVLLLVPIAHIQHATAHGNLVPPSLNGEGKDVVGGVFVVDSRLLVSVSHGDMTLRSPRLPGQIGDVHGIGQGMLTIPVKVEDGAVSGYAAIAMHWEIAGDAAGIPLTASLELDHEVLTMVADVPRAAPELVAHALPFFPVGQPLELHARAQGTLPLLAITANGSIGTTAFDAKGQLDIDGDRPFVLDADLGTVNGAMFGGPVSNVSGHAHAEGTLGAAGPMGTFTLSTKPGEVAGEKAPAIEAKGTFAGDRVTAAFTATEPGVALNGDLVLRVPEQKLDFDVTARSSDLRAIAQARGLVSGAGRAHANGTLDLARATVEAQVTADGQGISSGPASAGTAHVEAKLSGAVQDPVIDVTASGTRIRLATGQDAKPLEYPSATARGQIRVTGVPRVLGAEVRVTGSEKDTAIVATAREVRLEPGGVAVRGGRIVGLGEPLDIEGALGGGIPAIKLHAKGVDLRRLATMTGIAELRLLPPEMRADLDIDVTPRNGGAVGHVDVVLAGAADGTGAELHALLDGRRVAARGKATLGTAGFVELTSLHAELPASPTLASLARATGAADVRAEIDLTQVLTFLGADVVEQLEGRALLSARIERGSAASLPTVYASARTVGLDLTLAPSADNPAAKPIHVSGVDLGFHMGYDAGSDETETFALAWDDGGVLASLDGKARVPFLAWITGRKKFTREALGGVELGARVDMPERDVSKLPGVFANPELRGAITAHADIRGTLSRPDVTLEASGTALGRPRGAARVGQAYRPVDATIRGHWDGDRFVASFGADEARPRARRPGRAGALPAEAAATPAPAATSAQMRGLLLGRLSAADLYAGNGVIWNASSEVDVTNLELGPLPFGADIRGALTGHASLKNLAGYPDLHVTAGVEGLSIAGVRMQRGDFEVSAKSGLLEASATVKQEDGGTGAVQVSSQALAWAALDVDWDPTKQTRVDYSVDKMKIGILRPFVRRAIPELDGVVNGRGSAVIDAENQVFQGGLTLSGGRLYVNALGEEISDVSAIAQFERNGVFRLSNVTGKVGAGLVNASATGRMKGLHFEAADAVVVIPSKEGVPLSAEGATFAQATGEFKVKATVSAETGALLLTVDVPRTKITVPDRGTQNLQSLDPDPAIDVGVRQKNGRLVAVKERPGAAAALKQAAEVAAGQKPKSQEIAQITILLGNDVELEGRGLRISLSGRTVVDIAEEVAVAGQIALKSGGTIDVQGRKFVVDHGTVTFVEGESSADPVVVAAAYWDAPDRTRVWVEFNGPLKTGKLTLRSEPSFSKTEILSILLFGRADPNQATQGERPSDGQQAAALGTGLASSGLNRALGELNEDIDLEQDRTSANRVRTKVGYRLRRNLKVQLGYASGFSQREPDTTYLFLEWQFIPKWSLIGTRGDRGTSILDVLFQHRY
ncbi:MAG: hypothetical protein JWP97_1234 [Labilithrix sp.]|nr:hypothetical protein [Labilithrix sp.]